MKSARDIAGVLTRASLATLALATLLLLSVPPCAAAHDADAWTPAEMALIASMRLAALPPMPADASNARERDPRAIALGKRLFFDPRFSRDQRISCATCHDPGKQFQDGRPRGQGLGLAARRTMPIAGAAYGPWFFWDGRKDSLWSQALAPLEDKLEHGGNRARFVHLLNAHYRADYEAVFGPLGDLKGLPADAGPLGTPAEIAAWDALAIEQRQAVTRAFANLGKAIAAFEKTLRQGETRFDRYANALARGAAPRGDALSPSEIAGLRLFIGKAKCSSCHTGPQFTDHFFHSTRVPPLDAANPDPGRAAGAAAVQRDEFNCLGRYSDAKPEQCQELRFIVLVDPALKRAFKTPGLRGVAERAPYMHAGQFGTLEDVIRHYVKAPEANLVKTKTGHGHGAGSEIEPLPLTEQEIRDLAAFLGTLSGPVLEAPPH